MLLKIGATLFAGLIFSSFVFSQNTNMDAGFVKTFDEQITGRIYIGKKFTRFTLDGPKDVASIRYKPNTPTSLGLSFSYKNLSLGMGYGFGFLNPQSEAKGKTKSFDLQTHIYSREWITDIYGQFYKGYYLRQEGATGASANEYYKRPDMGITFIGGSVYKLFNSDEFSYRAGFLQNEWQLQSAGSFLAGVEAYYGGVHADSAFVPAALSAYYPQKDVKKLRVLEIGPGAGYAYTYVWQENFFITGSITANADISFVQEVKENKEKESKVGFSPNANLRAAAGYNSDQWAATLSWVNNSTNAKGKSSDNLYRLKTGEFKLTLAHRFLPGKRFVEKVGPYTN